MINNFKNKNNYTSLHFALTLRNFKLERLIKQLANEQIRNKVGILPHQCLDNGLSISELFVLFKNLYFYIILCFIFRK